MTVRVLLLIILSCAIWNSAAAAQSPAAGEAAQPLAIAGGAPKQEMKLNAKPDMAIAMRNIRAGDIIAENDLAGADGVSPAPEGMVGLQATRSIYKGRPVLASVLRQPIMVSRNAVVAMEYRRGGLIIRTEGRALNEGGIGERVRVMNLGSRQTVSAQIVGPGEVRVGG